MKSQYILTEEEYEEIIRIIDVMDADLGSLVGHMDDVAHVEKCAVSLSRALGRLGKNLNR